MQDRRTRGRGRSASGGPGRRARASRRRTRRRPRCPAAAAPSGTPNSAPDRQRLGVEAGPDVARRSRPEPGVARGEGRVDERRVDPQRERRVASARSGGRAARPRPRRGRGRRCERWSPLSRRISARAAVAVPYTIRRYERSVPARRAHGSARKSECWSTPSATSGWAIWSSRARGPAPSEEGRLAVESPGLGAGAVEPGAFGIEAARRPGGLVLVGAAVSARSAGGRPPTRPPGTRRRRASSLTVSTGMNGSMPSLIASPRRHPRGRTASHGTPTA